MRRRHQRHSTVDDFRQNLDPLQVTLAHRNQSHRQSPTSSNAGSVTFQLCRNRTLQLCGYTHISHKIDYGTEGCHLITMAYLRHPSQRPTLLKSTCSNLRLDDPAHRRVHR
ncbi:hypothetical protein ELI38_10470 [Rhizobium leguminosarum]|nr:hypothetical protein ELI38_10470 [Rhizobium leguminosarum]TAX50951.1 hypothetical protein ELH99_12725 [Rhizobium leguminosarum]TAY37461.1 hypothetical protein ELH89_10260 [Rhizobium leguminosarum]TAZ61970.1 hypothetical protein ELH75_12455 [Rhizobium leguminosarum]